MNIFIKGFFVLGLGKVVGVLGKAFSHNILNSKQIRKFHKIGVDTAQPHMYTDFNGGVKWSKVV